MELKDFESNIQSQYGEDGVIEEIFNRIGNTNKYCVEFGSWDGVHLSNTWHLWHNLEWSALLIEGEKERFKVLKENTKNFQKVKIVNEFVGIQGKSSLESILAKSNAPEVIDLLSIDIDGDDYHVFSSLDRFKPRVVVIEYNPTIPPHLNVVQEPGEYFGASALAITELAHKKGYKLVHLTDTNLFFVLASDFIKMNMTEVVLEADFKYRNLTTVITSFDGNEFLSQKPPFKWKIPVEETSRKFLGLLKSTPMAKRKPLIRTITDLIKVKIYRE